MGRGRRGRKTIITMKLASSDEKSSVSVMTIIFEIPTKNSYLTIILSSILVIFHFSYLPFLLSSILVIFHFCYLPFLLSSILVIFHFGYLPFWSSSILLIKMANTTENCFAFSWTSLTNVRKQYLLITTILGSRVGGAWIYWK